MEDFQIFSSENKSKKSTNSIFKFILIIFILIISLPIAYLSFNLGKKYSEKSENSLISTEAFPTIYYPSPTNQVLSSPSATLKKTEDTPTPTPKKQMTPTTAPTILLSLKILPSISELDGFRSSNGLGDNLSEIRIGNDTKSVSRGFLSFDITEIPPNVNIQSAVLKLYQGKIVGDPYLKGGKLQIDHLTYGDSLDKTDYNMPAILYSFTSFSKTNKIGWCEVDVTTKLKDDIANARSMSQFRIHFEKELKESSENYALFESQNNSMQTGNTPQLIVKYFQY